MHAKALSKRRRAKKTSERIKVSSHPRMCIHRTPRHTYVQVLEHNEGNSVVLVQASTVEKSLREKLEVTSNIKAAEFIGETIAERLLEKGIKQVAFDRRGYKYHGRVKAIAEAARNKGLVI